MITHNLINLLVPSILFTIAAIVVVVVLVVVVVVAIVVVAIVIVVTSESLFCSIASDVE